MKTYAIIPIVLEDEKEFEKRIENFTGKAQIYKRYEPTVYFVSYEGTTRDLATAVGLGEKPTIGIGIVLGIDTYWGFASEDLWEWLQIHKGQSV